MFFEMLQDSKFYLKIYWCYMYLCIFVIQAVMQGINARKVSLPYADPGIFVGGAGGGSPGLPA